MRPISPYQNELQDEEGFDIKCQKEWQSLHPPTSWDMELTKITA